MFEPGIYFGLPAYTYHLDPALGSGDVKSLFRGGKQHYSTPATQIGSAMHKLLLEGRQAFEATYIRRPEDPPGATSGDKGTATKALNAKMMVGQEWLFAKDYDFVERVGRIISRHPDLENVLDGAATEVSLFWRHELPEIPRANLPAISVPCKARFDAMKARGIADLKSIENMYKLAMRDACKAAIRRYRYDLQIEHYLEGRSHVRDFVRAGKVFFQGDAIPDRKRLMLLAEQAAAAEEYAFQIIFVPKSGAPTAWSNIFSPGNPRLVSARVDIDIAFDTYRTEHERFHADPEWSIVDPVQEWSNDEAPGGDREWD